ncbi:MAG: hypothetical protein EP330_03910 [Deltaproteobacteria bacterium]|nr:MAG: hypothetical protein EP330_03910 [Deltaproteobacteria bacterium]
MASLRDIFSDLVDRADQRLIGQLVASVSVDAESTRVQLRQSGRPFLDPEAAERPSLAEVEHTALHVIRQSRVRVGAFGGMASLAGALSVPPEVAATGVAGLRLAQRLAVIYGFDPDSDRGEMAVFQALAAGFDVNLPERGTVGVRVRDLPSLLVENVDSDVQSAGGSLATAVAKQSALLVGRRITRLVPVVFSGWSAFAARDRMDEIGRRMLVVLRRLAEAPAVGGDVEDAIEVA